MYINIEIKNMSVHFTCITVYMNCSVIERMTTMYLHVCIFSIRMRMYIILRTVSQESTNLHYRYMYIKTQNLSKSTCVRATRAKLKGSDHLLRYTCKVHFFMIINGLFCLFFHEYKPILWVFN